MELINYCNINLTNIFYTQLLKKIIILLLLLFVTENNNQWSTFLICTKFTISNYNRYNIVKN